MNDRDRADLAEAVAAVEALKAAVRREVEPIADWVSARPWVLWTLVAIVAAYVLGSIVMTAAGVGIRP